MNTAPTRRKRRTPEQMIADLEAEIAAVKQRAAAPTSRPRRKPTRRSTSAPDASAVEDLLRAAAAELGLSRAIAILNEQRQSLRGLGAAEPRELVPEPAPYVMPPARPPKSHVPTAVPVSLLAYERMAIQRAIAESGGNVIAAARLLKASKSTMYRRMHAVGLDRPSLGGAIAVAPDDPVLAAGVPVSFEEHEKAALVRALDQCDGNRLATARLLGVGKSRLYRMAGRKGLPEARGRRAQREDCTRRSRRPYWPSLSVSSSSDAAQTLLPHQRTDQARFHEAA